jgi:hypothetical protein
LSKNIDRIRNLESVICRYEAKLKSIRKDIGLESELEKAALREAIHAMRNDIAELKSYEITQRKYKLLEEIK